MCLHEFFFNVVPKLTTQYLHATLTVGCLMHQLGCVLVVCTKTKNRMADSLLKTFGNYGNRLNRLSKQKTLRDSCNPSLSLSHRFSSIFFVELKKNNTFFGVLCKIYVMAMQ